MFAIQLLATTATTASVLTLLYVAMSVCVIRQRWKARAAFGAGQDPASPLSRMIRVHGNFAEYAPLFLILLAAAELNQLAPLLLKLSAGAFAVGRVSHWIGMFAPKTPNPYRGLGMALTFIPLVTLALALLVRLFG